MTGACMSYSTEGFDRIDTRVEGVDSVTYAIGQGAPLVYFHGGGTFHGFEWVRPLADRFRVYCPYHPNFGESGYADFGSIADYVAHYELLLPALGLETFHLCGASMGGHLAARFAGANSADIDRLVLISPAGMQSDHAQMPDFSKVAPQDVPALFVADPAWVAPFWPAQPSAEWSALRARESAAALKARGDAGESDRLLRQALHGFDRPTLLLWGGEDRILPPGYLREWQDVLPEAEVEVIPGGSHLLPDEFPAAVEAIARFLAD